jgi:hypothetical protein
MVKFSIAAILGLVASAAHATPILEKRIAQVITQSTAKWEQACIAAGGGQKCNPVSVASFTTLLAAAGPCEQQDAADNQIDLAKQLNSQPMIALSQIFAQQPRNSPNSVSIPYCQKAPRHTELTGLFQCQFQGSNKQVFVGGVQVGGPGTIPFGRNAPVQPPGSCPANPGGPIPDGQQLVNIIQTPNAPVPASSGGNGNTPPAPSPSGPSPANVEPPKKSPAPPAPSPNAPPAGKAADGRAAQQLNAKFATLTPESQCNPGEIACVQSAFAQCVGGKFVSTPCAGGTICAALPLVNKSGTVVTCTTQSDAISRIQATGATGGLTG